MAFSNFTKRLSLSISLVLAGCSADFNPTPFNGLFGGAAIGAGSGALVGSVISNGDVGMSAALGAGIGAGAGLLVAVLATDAIASGASSRQPDYTEEFRVNTDEIYNNDRMIEDLREDLQASEPEGMPSRDRREHIYDGQSLGNVYR